MIAKRSRRLASTAMKRLAESHYPTIDEAASRGGGPSGDRVLGGRGCFSLKVRKAVESIQRRHRKQIDLPDLLDEGVGLRQQRSRRFCAGHRLCDLGRLRPLQLHKDILG